MVLVIVIVVLAGVGGYFGLRWYQQHRIIGLGLSPAPTVGADWKVYTNDQFSFQLSYPSSWHEETCNENYTKEISNYVFVSFGDKEKLVRCNTDAMPYGYINVGASTTGGTDLEKEVGYMRNSLDDFSRRDVQIGGIQAIRVEGSFKELEGPVPAPGTKYIALLFVRNDIRYNIMRFDEENLAEFEQVLATFKFTK